MNQRTAFERQLADELRHQIGEVPDIDAIEVTRSVTGGGTAPDWGSGMRPVSARVRIISLGRGDSMSTALKYISAAGLVALLGSLLAINGVMSPDPEVVPGAPQETQLMATSEWTTRGDPENGLSFVNALEIAPDGNIWVRDGEGAFQIIAPDGTFIESWGTPGSAPGELSFDREIDNLSTATSRSRPTAASTWRSRATTVSPSSTPTGISS